MKQTKASFEANKRVYESVLLTFRGVDGYDVYNCSVPFFYKGKMHIYGRVEKRDIWAASHVRLFEETGKDEFTVVPGFYFQLEDPYVAKINNEMIFGGTHVRKDKQEISSYYGYFYRGTPDELTYFTTGPDCMKDIRVLQLQDGRLGVFSRPRVGCRASIGFVILNSIDELGAEVIAKAPPLDILSENTWGGVNQAYLLSSGKVGCIGHYSYEDTDEQQQPQRVYVNYSFVLDPQSRAIADAKIIGTKSCYPPCEPKVPFLADCVFASGIVMRSDGRADLYSGVGDSREGRITIDYPFKVHGTIIGDLNFPMASSLLEHHHHHH
nr:MTP4 [synthetic construct]